MQKVLRKRDTIDKLYVSRKKRRVLAIIEGCVYVSKEWLEDNIKQCRERLITAASHNTGNRKQQKQENKNGKRNNCIDVFNDEQAKFHMRKQDMAKKREMKL